MWAQRERTDMALVTDEFDSEWDDSEPWLANDDLAPPTDAEPDPDAPRPDLDIDDFLNEQEPEYDWVIPGLVERGDRIILTGQEGRGKSTLLRQIAVQSSAGIHPFTLEPMDPIRVYLLDLENSKRHVRRKLRPLRLAAPDLKPEHLRIRVMAQGLDLLHAMDEEWLERRIIANRPDLVITGPLYKLASGDPTEEKVARYVAHILDRLRTKYDFAVLLEAHTPHPSGGGAKRPERPYGASLWMRWPEFGIFLANDGHLRHWRGERDERTWPAGLQRGGEWPWTPLVNQRDVTFALIVAEVRSANRLLSVRHIAERLKADRSTVQRAIDANKTQWEDICREYTV